MQKIRMTSRKYDGRLRDEYEAFLYAEDQERLVVYAPVGTMSYDRHQQAWVAAPDGLLEIYFKHRWYNVWHICEQRSNINQIYSNLSMPAVRTAAGIEWVDLDLDYRIYLDGRLEQLDAEEYQAHIASMGYSLDVQAQVQAACAEIEALYQQRADPFNHAAQVALYQQIQALAAMRPADRAEHGHSMTDSDTIRVARLDDLAALPIIERAAAALFRTTPFAYLADDDLVSTEVDLAQEYVWVAVDPHDQPIAFAIVHLLDESVHLHELDVHPDYARQGLGRRLIATVADWARERGAAALTLTTFADVPWNGPYYTRLGFRPLDLTRLSPGLQAVRQGEAEAGLPMAHRICMQLDLEQ